MMGLSTLAIAKLHMKERCNPKFNSNVIVPYVSIDILFAAVDLYVELSRRPCNNFLGNIDSSALELTRHLMRDV